MFQRDTLVQSTMLLSWFCPLPCLQLARITKELARESRDTLLKSWLLCYGKSSRVLTHWLPELFAKNAFLDILVALRLDLTQISFNPVENAFAIRQLVLLASRIAFCDILERRSQNFEIFWTRRWPTSLGFSISGIFFPLSFFFFSFLFAAMIDLVLGLLAVKKRLRKRHPGGQFLLRSS